MIYTEILDRLKYYYKINDDKDLARILGVISAVMSNWRTGKNDPDLSRIIKKAIEDQVNLDWLFCVNANSICLTPRARPYCARRRRRCSF